jgi:xylulokinase
VGITASSTVADFNRAVLEGVAFSLRQVYDKIAAGKAYTRMNIAGGGSKSPLWRQIFADVFNMEVVTLDGAGEGSGFGATVVAAVGCGLIGSTAEASAMLTVKSVTKPNPENVAAYESAYEKYLTLYERLKGL